MTLNQFFETDEYKLIEKLAGSEDPFRHMELVGAIFNTSEIRHDPNVLEEIMYILDVVYYGKLVEQGRTITFGKNYTLKFMMRAGALSKPIVAEKGASFEPIVVEKGWGLSAAKDYWLSEIYKLKNP